MAETGNRPDCAYFLLLGLCGAAFLLTIGGILTYIAFNPGAIDSHPHAALSHIPHFHHHHNGQIQHHFPGSPAHHGPDHHPHFNNNDAHPHHILPHHIDPKHPTSPHHSPNHHELEESTGITTEHTTTPSDNPVNSTIMTPSATTVLKSGSNSSTNPSPESDKSSNRHPVPLSSTPSSIPSAHESQAHLQLKSNSSSKATTYDHHPGVPQSQSTSSDYDKKAKQSLALAIIGPLCLLMGIVVTLIVGVLALKYDCDHEPEPNISFLRLRSEMSLNFDPDKNNYELLMPSSSIDQAGGQFSINPTGVIQRC